MQLSKLYKESVACLLLASSVCAAQKDAEYLYEGNKLYNSGKVPESTTKYSRALELNPNNRKANFNLGNSLYKNAMEVKSGAMVLPESNTMKPDSLAGLIFDKASQNFAVVANSVSDKDTLHQAWHNIGNCYLQKKDYQQAVDAYKKSLKFNPKDEETRYNLAYALKNLPKQKGGGGGGQGKPQQSKGENKEDKGKPQQQQSQMSKDQAEQLLKALMDSEKKLQDKRKQKQEDAANSANDKDW
ncbi:tetratricopeptide repeat protein [Aurantibacillus circumpalustris]|uniref:tetratricopeptide repeat protein n=1 Tax=Aurantibacillus circumpalustris TaxID=3036359 RepID=UPI00295B59A8|nr:tetratricopeptide repeat protein [Aurantibacillus circumpalustris]